jgi:hypothetical protein
MKPPRPSWRRASPGGLMVEVAPIDGSFHAKLEESAGHVAV